MSKKVVPILLIIVVGIIIVIGFRMAIHTVCFHETSCFSVSVAADTVSRQKGLMFRNSLDHNKGMLFIFPQSGLYSFWMKNTLIPLDIIWISSDKKIVFMQESAQPCGSYCQSLNPGVPAQYVVEVNAGAAREAELHIGDTVSFH